MSTSDPEDKKDESSCFLKTERRSLQNLQLNTNKAGMNGLDTDKINEIIQKASKGSKFYIHKQKCQERVDSKIAQMKLEAKKFTKEQIKKAEDEMLKISLEMEQSRDLSKVIVHIDMDMFYAAVEMRDDPSLRNKPMAVGGNSMLSTSNYLARKYGVRAAMPGFIAKKLCPDLVIVPCNFDKYKKVSAQIQMIFEDYDPQFSPMSLDEAYLDITEYLKANEAKYKCETSNLNPAELVVHEIRKKIEETTQLTASAGIAVNTMLAKVCSDMNKPNGQFYLPPDEYKIQEFIRDLPIRKVSGIGNITEQHLRAFGIITCSDVWTNRGIIRLLFSETSYRHFLAVSKGLGSTNLTPATERDRKSISNETTFQGSSDKNKLFKLCEDLCHDLKEDMVKKDLYGKVFTLKFKTTNFQVRTRAHSLLEYTQDEKLMTNLALKILSHEMESELSGGEPLSLRLLGVRMSNLVEKSQLDSKKQTTLTELFKKTSERVKTKDDDYEHLVKETPSSVDYQEFDEDISRDTKFSVPNNNNNNNNNKNIITTAASSSSSECVVIIDDFQLTEDHSSHISEQVKNDLKIDTYTCPVCSKNKFNDIETLNKHLDTCLSLETVHKLVSETNSSLGYSSKQSEKSPFSKESDKTSSVQLKRKSISNNKRVKKQKSHSQGCNTLYKYLESQ